MRKNRNGLRSMWLAVGLAVVGLATSAVAGEVKLDYTNFDARLDELASDAGITTFSAAEKTQIRNNIKAVLDNAYSGFNFTFTTSPTGPAATISFGLPGPTPTALGLADGIDYRNKTVSDLARVYSRNFNFIVNEFSGSTDRATQIAQLTAALGGTAVHELGHNLGLRHYDAYGDNTLTWTGGAIATAGVQNGNWLATGSTGLDELGREAPRVFSDLAYAKLNYAAEAMATPLGSIAETALAHSTIATAQSIAWSALTVTPLGGYEAAANVLGALTARGTDMYEVQGLAGALFTANVLGLGVDGIAGALGNAMLTLYDAVGNILAFNDDIAYSGNTFFGGTLRTLDSLILNYRFQTDGLYYVGITGLDRIVNTNQGPLLFPGTGNYELLMATTDIRDPGPIVPLPPAAWMGLVGLVGIGVLRRRRRTAA